MFHLKNRRILITGASGGIGQDISKTMASLGAEVVLTGTKIHALSDLKKHIEDEGGHATIYPFDLSDLDKVDTLFDMVQSEFGDIDTLINNAGITKDNLILRMSNDDWNQVLNTNLTVAFKLSRSAIKAMIRRRFGRIINISSVVAVMGNPGQANYCASKAGLIGMSKALAYETASRQVTINCVAPGFIQSAMTDKLSAEQQQYLHNMIPMKRSGTGVEVASACAFLASQEASYITGQTIHVNGGLEMI